MLSLLLISVPVCLPSPVQKQNSDATQVSIDVKALEARADALALDAISQGSVPGLSIAVVHDGSCLVAKGYGYADPERAVPATAHTIYPIGTLTRVFTAGTVLRLVERGDVALGDELSKFVPEFPARGRKITVRDLLAGASGVPGFSKLREKHPSISSATDQTAFLQAFEDVPFEFEPGTASVANGADSVLLSLLVARVSKQPYTAHVTTELIEPLGLTETRFCPKGTRPAGFAVDCQSVATESEFELPGADASIASQCLASSATDIGKWISALFEQEFAGDPSAWWGALNGKPSTSANVCGLRTDRIDGREARIHIGGSNGSSAALAYFPASRLTVIVLANCPTAPVARIQDDLARVALSLSPSGNEDLPVSTEEVSRYSGSYQVATTQIRIVFRDGHLWYTPPVQAPTRLRSQGNSTFRFENESETVITFVVDSGKCSGFTLRRSGYETKGVRLDGCDING